jgi:hypothetical protein
MIRYLGPVQTVCDGWTFFWTDLSEHLSEATTFGFAQRALLNSANHQKNNVGSAGATAPANGYEGQPPIPPDTPSQAEFLKGPAYSAGVSPSGSADCETGQRGYPLKLNHLDPKGRDLETDAHTPGLQGPTYPSLRIGRRRVPPGETFSRNPQIGPQLPFIPGNN